MAEIVAIAESESESESLVSLISLAKEFQESIDEEKDDILLIGVKEKVGRIKAEFRTMVCQLELVNTCHRAPNELTEIIRSVILRAHDLVQTYKKVSHKSKYAMYKKLIYWRQRQNLNKKLDIIIDDIMKVIRGWILVNVEYTNDEDNGNDNWITEYWVEETKEKLMMNPGCLVIPIVGMKISHKKALLDLVMDDAVRQLFPCNAWVRVPASAKEYTTDSISTNISNQIMMQATQLASSSSSGVLLLQDILRANSCLIVLDEVRTPDVRDLLCQVFQTISTPDDDASNTFNNIGSRIILIISNQASSLVNSTSFGRIFHSSIDMPHIGGNVPSYLMQFLYYFLLFPDGTPVSVRRLIVLWVGGGVVHAKKNENGSSVEDVAKDYLNKLIALNLVRIAKKKSDGEVKACLLNYNDGSNRDMWLEMAKETRFFDDKESITGIVDNHGINDSSSSFIPVHSHVPSSSQNYKNVVSLMSFDTREGKQPGEEIGDFLNKCILAGCFLRLGVLDLEQVFRPRLPKAISKLTVLWYLGLRWTYLEYLPKYVCMLPKLQVIDVKHTYIKILPKSIWRMKYLRHLCLSETYRTRFDKLPSTINLHDLQTLWGAFIDEKTSIEDGLGTLLNIRKLGLSCRFTSSRPNLKYKQLKSISSWISRLRFLNTLRLKSLDEDNKASELYLDSLEANSNLSTIYLLGKLCQNVVSSFPANLIEVTLSGSALNEDPMQHLGKLKELLVLRLRSHSVTLNTMSCSRGSFPKLEVFQIWQLPNLENWEAEGGALPSLKYLEIRRCHNLKMIPEELQRIVNLGEFELTGMPQRFIDDIKTMRPKLWSKIKVNDYPE